MERSGVVLAAQLLPHQQQGGQLAKLAVGQVLRLLVDRTDADGVLVRLGDGQRLRLLGMERAPAPGAVLLLRVLSTAPRLELVWLQAGTASATAAKLAATPALKPRLVPNTESESAAMRPNQALLQQQVATSIQDAATLALSWRAMVLAQLHQHALLRAQADGQHVPGSLFGSDAGAALLREVSRERMAPPGLEQGWLLSAYVWTGRRLLLSVVGSEEEPPRPARRRRESLALRLELTLPRLGPVKLQLRLIAGGVALDLAAEHAPALNFLRYSLRAMVAALARAELRLVRCRLGPDLPVAGALAANSASGPMISPALFRAAAELALLLSNPPASCWPQDAAGAATNEAANPAYPVWTSADGADDADFALFGDFVIR